MQVRKTKYKGIEFRSRLEARWAVFFDALGLSWEYEPEGYRLDDGTCYLPDFYVHNISGHVGKIQHGDGIYVEVKGKLTDDDKVKLNGFQYPIYVVGNLPASKDPWTDVTIQFEANPRYMFSEYTVDGTIEDLWFAKKGSQVYLIRWSEAKKNKNMDSCSAARDAALNKKFEYENSGAQGSGRRADEARQSSSGRRRTGSMWEGAHSPFSTAGSAAADEHFSWSKGRTKERMDLQTFKTIFLSLPGIKEYSLEERIHFNDVEKIPLACSLVDGYDDNMKRLYLSYHYLEDDGDIWNSRFDARQICYIQMRGNDSNEISRDYKHTLHPFKHALDWMKKEMYQYVTKDPQNRIKLNAEEAEDRKRLSEEVIEEHRVKADENSFIAMNNPYTVAELAATVLKEIKNPESKYTYREVLAKFELAKGRDIGEKFGIGKFIMNRRGEVLIMQMRRSYEGYTSAGRLFRKFDGRELFTLDARLLNTEDPRYHTTERDKLQQEFQKCIEVAMKRLGEKQRGYVG